MYLSNKVRVGIIPWRIIPPRNFKEVVVMKVVYSNGQEGILNEEESAKLYTRGRHTKESWQELKDEMNRLRIIKFEDWWYTSTLGAGLIPIDYVNAMIAVL